MSFETRMDTLVQFANGTHPLMVAALWEANPLPREEAPISLPHQPRIPLPDITTTRRTEGDITTERQIDEHLATGAGISIEDGYTARICTSKGPVIVLVDTKSDPYLAGIIHKAQTVFDKHPNWEAPRKLFEIGLLCFGDWGQQRYSFDSLQQSTKTPKLLLGEFIWTTEIADLECATMSMTMQAVGSRCGINTRWHMGQAARFSSYCHGAGPHAWTIVQNEPIPYLVDWTNYPPQLADLFASAGIESADVLYDEFCRVYGRFPIFKPEQYPPTLDQYEQLQNGDNTLLAARERTAYWSDSGAYLGSCPLPIGWSNFN